MAYCRAHESIDNATLATLEQDLLRIQSLLITGESDDVDALQAAADECYEQAFSKSDGGTLWHFHQESDPSTVPTAEQVAAMKTLNENQKVFDNTVRETTTKRWELFANWWLYGRRYLASALKRALTNTDSIGVRPNREHGDVPIQCYGHRSEAVRIDRCHGTAD